MKENTYSEVIKYLSHLVCVFNKVKGMMKFMNEYDSKYWKHGNNITVEQFCKYVMQYFMCVATAVSACIFHRT